MHHEKMQGIRYRYFVEVMHGEVTGKMVPMSDLPPKAAAAVDGISWLPRLIAKARIKLRGEMDPDLMYGCAGDRPFLRKHSGMRSSAPSSSDNRVNKRERRSFDHRADFRSGCRLLKRVGWRPNPEEMLKLPSIAKGTELRALIELEAANVGENVEQIVERVYLAARSEHLSAIGGASTRDHLLSDRCILSADDIAKLCRRMPPFISVKLEELKTGPIKVDANPTNAFDTNGCGELRTRLPKFRSSLQHYASQSRKIPADHQLNATEIGRIRSVLDAIKIECGSLQDSLSHFTPVGSGKTRPASQNEERTLPWTRATVKLAQVHGVLQKTNRDLNSKHWKSEWIPTTADLEIVSGDVRALLLAADSIRDSLSAV